MHAAARRLVWGIRPLCNLGSESTRQRTTWTDTAWYLKVSVRETTANFEHGIQEDQLQAL